MPMQTRSGGAWRTVTNPQVRVSGTWRPVQQGWVRVAGAWRQFYNRFSVSANSVSGSGGSGINPCGSVTTSPSIPNTAVSGGVGPFTYSWTRIANPNGSSFTISGSTQAQPTWSATVCDGTAVETWRVTVTDTGNGNATTSADITVTLSWAYTP